MEEPTTTTAGSTAEPVSATEPSATPASTAEAAAVEMSAPEEVSAPSTPAVDAPAAAPVAEAPAAQAAPETALEAAPAMAAMPGPDATATQAPAAASPAPEASNPSPTINQGVNPATFVPGSNGPLPAELHGWNWGAFFLNWIWGVSHRTWIALLCFVPLVNIVMPFVLGAKGNEWAWQNRPFKSVEEFKQTQRVWTIWGAVSFGVSILAFFMFFGVIMAFVGLAATSSNSGDMDYSNNGSSIEMEMGN